MKRLAIAAVGLALVVAAACGGEEEAEKIPTARVQEPGSPTAKPADTPSFEARVHYDNTAVGFAFDYPELWAQLRQPMPYEEEVGAEMETVASVALGRFVEEPSHLEGFGVTVRRRDTRIAEEELDESLLEVDGVVALGAGRAGGAVEETDWTELGGWRARRYVVNYPHPLDGVPMTQESVITLRADLEFQLDCQAVADRFEAVHAGCQVVYDSFEFTSDE